MEFWLTILGAIIIGVASSFKGDSNGCGSGGGKTPPRRKSDFRESELDDEIEDFDRMFGDDL